MPNSSRFRPQARRRRGTARLEVGNAKEAIADLEIVQECEPENKEVAELLQKARAKVGRKAGAEKPMTRMQIEEVEEEETEMEAEADPRQETEERVDSAGEGTSDGHASAAAEPGKEEEQQRAEKGGTDKDKTRKGAQPVGPKRSQARGVDGGTRKDPSEASTGSAAEARSSSDDNPGEESEGSGKKEAKAPMAEASGKEGPSQKEADGARLAEEWREKGNVLYKRGDVTGAEACYTQSLTYSENAAALSNRAMCRNRFGRFREAEEDASAAIIADPAYVKAYHRRAAARRGLHKKEQAMEDYKVRN